MHHQRGVFRNVPEPGQQIAEERVASAGDPDFIPLGLAADVHDHPPGSFSRRGIEYSTIWFTAQANSCAGNSLGRKILGNRAQSG